MTPSWPEVFLAASAYRKFPPHARKTSGTQGFLAPTAKDVSAFGQRRKFPPHARKTSGTQGRVETEVQEIKGDSIALSTILNINWKELDWILLRNWIKKQRIKNPFLECGPRPRLHKSGLTKMRFPKYLKS